MGSQIFVMRRDARDVIVEYEGSYFNSAEQMCRDAADGNDATVLYCDDFEDGAWAFSGADWNPDGTTQGLVGGHAPENDGWFMVNNAAYPGTKALGHDGLSTDPENTNHGRCVVDGFQGGAAGTLCTATTYRQNVSVGTNGASGWHYFSPGGHSVSQYQEIYVRWYLRQRSSANAEGGVGDFVMGHEKHMNFSTASGSWVLFVAHKFFGGGTFTAISIVEETEPSPPGWMSQNPGTTGNPSIALAGNLDHWFYIEVRVKLDDAGMNNGELDMWVDDCGVSGLECTGPGTLRSTYRNRNFRQAGNPNVNDTQLFNHTWMESWGNPGSTGTQDYDQFIARTIRIGPMTPL